MPANGRACYAYGVVRRGLDTREAPGGIGGAGVHLVEGGDVAALVSSLDAGEYSPEQIEAQSGEVEWLAPRAEAHDEVVSWAGNPGPVVPLPMWTMFSDEAAVRAMLRERHGILAAMLSRLEGSDEYGLRVYADAEQIARAAMAHDPEIADLRRQADAAGPGLRYLIQRKLERAGGEAARGLAAAAADRIYEELRRSAVEASRDPIPVTGAADGSAVLSAAFLVKREGVDSFRGAVTGVVREFEPDGYRFAFTGPWPPYHFAEVR